MKRTVISCALLYSITAITGCKRTEPVKNQLVSNTDEILKRASVVVEGTSQYRGMVASAIVDGRVVEIGDTDEEGAGVQQWDWLNKNYQKWTAAGGGNGFLKIINIGNGKLLTSPNDDPGAQLIQKEAAGTDAQLWKMKSSGEKGFYHFVNKNGLYGTLNNAENGNGMIVTQDNANGSIAQKWFVQKLFKNPVRKNVADPWVYHRNGTYYFVATTGYNITMYKTAKMSDLSRATGKAIWWPPAGQMYSNNVWAPELHHLDGKWYVYFAADNGVDANHRMHVLENDSEDPTTGTWVYKGKISDPSDIWAIDGSILEHNSKRYFMWSGWKIQNTSESGIQQIYIAEMSNPWTISSDRYLISEPTYNWERDGWVNEGPQIIKNANGDVFLVYSGSGCWTDNYKLGMMKLTGTDPLLKSSWTKYSTPVFEKSVANSVYAPGHNSFFKSPDGTEDWLIYHANSASGQGCGGLRSTRMQKINWNQDGTPNFGIPKALTESLPVPSGEPL